MMALILAADLIFKFNYALANKWGYIINTAGILWTQAKQNSTTSDTAKKYG